MAPRLTEEKRRALDALLARAVEWGTEFVAIVSSFCADLGDADALEAEAYVAARTKSLGVRLAIFRPGHVLSRLSDRLRRFGVFYPLAPARMCSCFLDAEELFAAIESEIHATDARRMPVFSLFGANRSWRDLLAERRVKGFWSQCIVAVSFMLSWLLLGQFAALILDFLACYQPSLRRWNVGTLQPAAPFRGAADGLQQVQLCARQGRRVQQRCRSFPGISIPPRRSSPPCTATASLRPRWPACGPAPGRLRHHGSQGPRFPCPRQHASCPSCRITPYVCLGTAFFVPIHGSAADYSTIAETIARVLYDPRTDRIISVASDEPEFRACVYNLEADVLVLQALSAREAEIALILMHSWKSWPTPAAPRLLARRCAILNAANVEIRKARRQRGDGHPQQVLPRSRRHPGAGAWIATRWVGPTVGDRLEENCVTSFLMPRLGTASRLARRVFFTAEEFATFWATHQALAVEEDPGALHPSRRPAEFAVPRPRLHIGGPVHAPPLSGTNSKRYLANTFTVIRSNPGKHSRWKRMEPPCHPLIDTIEQMLHEQTPNLLRLYLNPHVTQTCFCLNRYIPGDLGQPDAWRRIGNRSWRTASTRRKRSDQAGALCFASVAGRPTAGLVVDPSDRLGPFAGAAVAGGNVEFLPGLVIVSKDGDVSTASGPFGLVVLVAGPDLEMHADAVRALIQRLDRPGRHCLRGPRQPC